MEKIKRYKLEDVGYAYNQDRDMVEDKDGDWVKYEDVEALESGNAKAERVNRFNDSIRNILEEKRINWLASNH